MKPYVVRFMTEVGCDFAPWGHASAPVPGAPYENLARVLPISDDLRTRILAWASSYCRYDGGKRDLDVSAFDGRGMHLSRELQRELGEAYTVQYHFTFFGSRAKWLPTVAHEPCPGWRAS
jgi:hypothetical protein